MNICTKNHNNKKKPLYFIHKEKGNPERVVNMNENKPVKVKFSSEMQRIKLAANIGLTIEDTYHLYKFVARINYTDPVSGKRKVKRETVFAPYLSENDAKKAVIQKCKQLLKSSVSQSSLKNFGEIVEKVREFKKSHGIKVDAEKSVYSKILRDCGNFSVNPDKLGDQIEHYLNITLRKEISKHTGKTLSNARRNRINQKLHAICTAATKIKAGTNNFLLSKLPMDKYRTPILKEEPKRIILSVDQINAGTEYFKRTCEYLYWMWLFKLKNPIGEIDFRDLHCKDINLKNNTITYKRHKTGVYGTPIIYDELVDYCTFRYKRWKNNPHDNGYVFQWYNNTRIPESITKSQYWKGLRSVIGIKDFTEHDLRHHAAYWLISIGTSIPDIMQIGAWANVDTLLRYHGFGQTENIERIQTQVRKLSTVSEYQVKEG